MTSIIVDASKDNGMSYLNAQGLARRTLKHGDSMSSPIDLAGSIAESYHEWVASEFRVNNKETLAEWYKDHCKVRLAKDLNGNVTGGYVVLRGYIMGLFSFTKGNGQWLVRQAIADGGRSLDCFDGYLVEFYKGLGFKETARVANYTAGGPDVVYMGLPQ